MEPNKIVKPIISEIRHVIVLRLLNLAFSICPNGQTKQLMAVMLSDFVKNSLPVIKKTPDGYRALYRSEKARFPECILPDDKE